jgi:hypothetical protein
MSGGTSEGSTLTRFRRALAVGNGPAAYAAATELQRVELADALALTLLLAGNSELFDRACVRWVARFALEVRGVGLREAYLAQASLSAVRPGQTVGAHSAAPAPLRVRLPLGQRSATQQGQPVLHLEPDSGSSSGQGAPGR